MANLTESFVALADPTRRKVFERLARRSQSVRELADTMPVSRPAVSQHLRVLKDAGLVVHQSQGTRNIYSIDPRGVGAMRDYLDRFWDVALAEFKIVVEKESKK